MSPDARSQAVRRVLWITLGLNLAVAAAKIVWGHLTSTLSMTADGYHSLLDGASNVVGLVGLSVAHRPPDADHHYGHRKFEVLASVAISVMLFLTAGEILIGAWRRIGGEGAPAVFSPLSMAIMVATTFVNLGVSRYEAARGRALHSPFLLADSRHTATDVYASVSVLIAVAGLKLGWAWIDPAAAVAIGAVVVHAGFTILQWSLGVLSDRAWIDPDLITRVTAALPGVLGCEQVRSRGFADAVFVDLTVRLDRELTLAQAHDVCDSVESRLREAFPEIADVLVHPEPADRAEGVSPVR